MRPNSNLAAITPSAVLDLIESVFSHSAYRTH